MAGTRKRRPWAGGGARKHFGKNATDSAYTASVAGPQAWDDAWRDVLARRIARDAQELILHHPSVARGLIHGAAEALPNPMRPTRWGNGKVTESPASWLRSETVEDIANWADLASEYELATAAMAALRRLPRATRERIIREVRGDA